MKNLIKREELSRLCTLENAQLSEHARTRANRIALQEELMAEEYGLTPGETLVKRKSSGKVYRFFKADVRFALANTQVSWILGFRQLKSGDFGKRAETLFSDWERL